MKPTKEQLLARAARKEVGTYSSAPVHIIEGSDEPPTLEGHGWHFRTKGGRRIWHPNAYANTGWSNMVYINSTIRVTVGANWRKAA